MEKKRAGLLVKDKKGHVRVQPITGEDFSKVPVLNYLDCNVKKLPCNSKAVVKYEILRRRGEDKNTYNTVEIKEVSPEGYNLRNVEKIIEISKGILSLEKLLTDALEKSQDFRTCFNNAKVYLAEGNHKDAKSCIELAFNGCGDMMFKGNLKDNSKEIYHDLYSNLSKVNNSLLALDLLGKTFN